MRPFLSIIGNCYENTIFYSQNQLNDLDHNFVHDSSNKLQLQSSKLLLITGKRKFSEQCPKHKPVLVDNVTIVSTYQMQSMNHNPGD